MSDVINKKAPFFYILDKRDGSQWKVTEMDTTSGERLGWLNCVCIKEGTDEGSYLDAPCGIDAAFVFLSGKFDYSKNPFNF